MKKLPITHLQFIFLIYGIQIGTGILSLPRTLAEIAGTSGWISIIIGGFINIVFSVVIVFVMKKYPNDILPEIFTRLFGKVMGKILFIPVIAHFAFFSWTILVEAVLYIKVWFLPSTGTAYVMFLFAVPTYLIARKNLQVLSRYTQIVFYLTIWMPFILLFPLKDSHFINLLPLLKDGWTPIFKAVEPTVYSYIGFEITYFVYPHLIQKEKAIRGVIIGNTLTMLTYLFVTVLCFAFFSPDEITTYNQPVLNLLKVIEFRFLERFDMIFLSLYLFVVSTAWIPYTYLVSFGTAQLFGKRDHSLFIGLFLIAVVIMAMVTKPSWMQEEKWKTLAGYNGIIICYCLPVFLLIYITVYQKITRRNRK
ncbi:GerAB/ArcD/ProY family transporter [Paenibacillus sp. KN14-4R]|uniref:GerAB/ArcD/ProY family transporter n=1 Tax=Paenibacillus sp. KN14-4R TaxID=3445773 RepID=UPI003FA18EDA